jgi:hypothetical protein
LSASSSRTGVGRWVCRQGLLIKNGNVARGSAESSVAACPSIAAESAIPSIAAESAIRAIAAESAIAAIAAVTVANGVGAVAARPAVATEPAVTAESAVAARAPAATGSTFPSVTPVATGCRDCAVHLHDQAMHEDRACVATGIARTTGSSDQSA